MIRFLACILAAGAVVAYYGMCAALAEDAKADKRGVETAGAALPSVNEARARAALLHETMHATLHIVHLRYYREDEGLAIPAATLKKVFDEVANRQKVKMRWLVVDAEAMNVEHNPQNAFEQRAVQAIVAGKEDYESAENGVYRHVGRIALTSECLKCHLPSRTSTEDRTAGLLIEIPIRTD